jgi:hypothetical protein
LLVVSSAPNEDRCVPSQQNYWCCCVELQYKKVRVATMRKNPLISDWTALASSFIYVTILCSPLHYIIGIKFLRFSL